MLVLIDDQQQPHAVTVTITTIIIIMIMIVAAQTPATRQVTRGPRSPAMPQIPLA